MSMKLHIARPYVEALAADFPDLESLKAQLVFGDKVEVRSSNSPARRSIAFMSSTARPALGCRASARSW